MDDKVKALEFALTRICLGSHSDPKQLASIASAALRAYRTNTVEHTPHPYATLGTWEGILKCRRTADNGICEFSSQYVEGSTALVFEQRVSTSDMRRLLPDDVPASYWHARIVNDTVHVVERAEDQLW